MFSFNRSVAWAGLAAVLAVFFSGPAAQSSQGLPPDWNRSDPIPAQAVFLPDVNCNQPPPDQMPLIGSGVYWAKLGERTPGRSVNRRDEFKIELKAGQLLRLHLYPEGGELGLSISRVDPLPPGQATSSKKRLRHIYRTVRCRDFPGRVAAVDFTPLHDGEYRLSVWNAYIKTPKVRYVFQVEVLDNANPPADHLCAGQPVPPPGVEPKITQAVEGWQSGNGRSQWSLSPDTGLVRVWAHTYADVIDQVAHGDLVRDEEETVKVVDYKTFEVTGVPGALYRCDLSAELELKGLIDRMDYTLPVGGSATKYHAELVWGLAETTSPRQIDTAPGARVQAWKVGNNLWEDLAWDIAFAVAAGGLSIMPGSSVAFTILGNAVNTTLTVLPIIQDNISADEYVSNRYQVDIKNAFLEAGKQYMVYALMIGRVRTVSTGAAAGMCELDFWYRAPYLCEDEGHDALNGRGFRLKDYQVTFARTGNDPPCAPSNPSPGVGEQVIPQGSVLEVQWEGHDPDGEILVYDLYWGSTSPPPLYKRGLTDTKVTVGAAGDRTYHWRVVARDQKGNMTTGPLWYYTTSRTNHMPRMPEALTPRDRVSGVPVDTALAWQCSDPDGDPLTFRVTLAKQGQPPQDLGTFTDTTLDLPFALEPGVQYTWTVTALDGRGGETPATFSFTTLNQPPSAPYAPHPANQEMSFDRNQPLWWYVQDPEGDPLTCDLYLGRGTLPGQPTRTGLVPDNHGKVVHNQYLEPGAAYVWQVKVRDDRGRERTGPPWSFVTQGNQPPDPITDMSPADNAAGVSRTPTLSWSCQDPDGDELTYDLYLGTVNPPPLRRSGLKQPSLAPGTLAPNTIYFWRITARDMSGATRQGFVQSFTTQP